MFCGHYIKPMFWETKEKKKKKKDNRMRFPFGIFALTEKCLDIPSCFVTAL